MENFFAIFSLILGMLLGSFLNVVALRYNTGMTLKGRSKCFSCGKNLDWIELIPVFSFIFQKGRCKNCKTKISWQYPIIEIISGIIFTLIFISFPPISINAAIHTVIYLFISCLLLVITIYDIKHKIIPDLLVYTFDIVALIMIFFDQNFVFKLPSLETWIAGPLLALPFFCLWLFSQGRWMGLGDAKLVLGIGWLLGLISGISAVILAFWIGAVISLLWMYITFRKLKSGYEIPFGPYLILGMYLVLFFGIKIIDL